MTSNDKKSQFRNFLMAEINRIGFSLSTGEQYDFLKNVEELEANRTDFVSRYRGIPVGCESFFVILRKWNSYTPSLPASSAKKDILMQHSIGGGYFLFIQGPENEITPGYGLVIDPGYNFIHNFGLAGFCLDDIDGILITHAHNDHTNDFESLLSLLYQRNTKYQGRRRAKKADLFLNVGSFKKFSNYLDLAHKDSKNYIGKVTVMSPGQVIRIPNRDDLECEIITLFTNHHEIVTADYSLGICFKVAGRNVLITGDTGWSYNTARKNEDLLKENNVYTREENTANNIDVLVSHIGTIKRDEFNLKDNGKPFEDYYYDKHLGILGTISVIEQWKPDLCIISEFGEELTEIREKLVREIEITTKKIYSKLSCLPGDIGLFIFLDSRKSLCYLTGNLIEWNDISYKDVTDQTSQRSIKFYSDVELNRLVDKANILSKMKIYDGLRIYKDYYLKNVVIPGFELQDKTQLDLKKELSEITIDYSDPLSVQEDALQIAGRLIALSCIVTNPFELLDPLLTGKSTLAELALEMLRTYHVDLPECFDKFVLHCVQSGYDDRNKSAEEQILYENNKPNIMAFINAVKTGDHPSAEKSLDKMLKMTIADIWDSLQELRKVDILVEHGGVIEGIDLDGIKTTLSIYIKKYNIRVDDLNRECESVMITDDICWQGAYLPRTTYELNKILESTPSPKMREEIQKLIELSKGIDNIKQKAMNIRAEHSELLTEPEYKIIECDDEMKNFFYFLNFYLVKFGGELPAALIGHLKELFE